ncbi:MAG: YcxB family protein [Cytophagales bacterium]|nr:YcxB family protein [Cytophagales bacterium]MCA6370746.1 YcxB family protein [Cytophagales bacterium]MCA6376604.1 YcxB family protein [Cytophagales bacterium]MCA6385598.1 YcxB family protein [Cytophagales bacterium]
MIKFEQTTEDLIAFNSYYLKTHSTFFQKYWRWLVATVFSIYVFKTSGQIVDSLLNWGNWVIVGFVGLITFLLTRLADSTKRKALIAFIKNNPQNIGNRQIDYDEEKVTVITDSSSTDYKYSAFIKVEENDKYFFLFTGKQTALILAKKITDKDALTKLIEKLRTNSK